MLMNRKSRRARLDVAGPYAAAHCLADVDRRAAAGEQVDHDVAGLGEEPKQVLDYLRRHAAEVAALVIRLVEVPDVEVLP